MKLSIYLTLLFCLFISTNSFGMDCSKRGVGVSESTLSLKSNGVLVLGFSGASRNTYLASYKYVVCKNNRAGKQCAFKKINDQSTWKNMPENVYVDFGTLQNVDAVVLRADKTQFTFNPFDCTEYFKYSRGFNVLP